MANLICKPHIIWALFNVSIVLLLVIPIFEEEYQSVDRLALFEVSEGHVKALRLVLRKHSKHLVVETQYLLHFDIFDAVFP